MISADEMRKLLKDEFGIKNDDELSRALKQMGGIRIGIFTDEKKGKKQEVSASTVA